MPAHPPRAAAANVRVFSELLMLLIGKRSLTRAFAMYIMVLSSSMFVYRRDHFAQGSRRHGQRQRPERHASLRRNAQSAGRAVLRARAFRAPHAGGGACFRAERARETALAPSSPPRARPRIWPGPWRPTPRCRSSACPSSPRRWTGWTRFCPPCRCRRECRWPPWPSTGPKTPRCWPRRSSPWKIPTLRAASWPTARPPKQRSSQKDAQHQRRICTGITGGHHGKDQSFV